MRNEEWRPVPGFPRYEISDYGRLRKAEDHSFIYSLRKNNKGRIQYALQQNGKTRHVQAHVLVLENWVSPAPEGMECRHLDGNHLNNFVGNLVWGTHAENMADKIKHGTSHTEWCHSKRALTDEQVREIRAKYRKGVRGFGLNALGDEYGVSPNTIHQIINRKTYSNVDPE